MSKKNKAETRPDDINATVNINGTVYNIRRPGPDPRLPDNARRYQTVKALATSQPGAVHHLKHNRYHSDRNEARRVSNILRDQGFVAQAIDRRTGKAA